MNAARFAVRDRALFDHLVSKGYPVIEPGVLNAVPTPELRDDVNQFYRNRAAASGYLKRNLRRDDEQTIRTLNELAAALTLGGL